MKRSILVLTTLAALSAGAMPAAAQLTNPNAPAFSASSPCSSVVLVSVFGTNQPITFSASDPDIGQSVSMSALGLPAWAAFSSSAGNPASATIVASPTVIDWVLSLFFGGAVVTVRGADNGSPQRTTDCVVTIRPRVF